MVRWRNSKEWRGRSRPVAQAAPGRAECAWRAPSCPMRRARTRPSLPKRGAGLRSPARGPTAGPSRRRARSRPRLREKRAREHGYSVSVARGASGLRGVKGRRDVVAMRGAGTRSKHARESRARNGSLVEQSGSHGPKARGRAERLGAATRELCERDASDRWWREGSARSS